MRTDDARGFSLLEMTCALGLTMIVVAGVFSAAHPAQGAFAAEPDAADLQQRLRVAASTLSRELAAAGAGGYLDPLAGPLGQIFPAVLPFRHGAIGSDPPGTFASDRITVLRVPPTVAETTLTADLIAGTTTMTAAPGVNCAPGTNLCGFRSGVSVLVYDANGAFDTFTVVAVADAASQIVVAAPPDAASMTFAAGAKVVESVSRTYSLKADPVTGVQTLMQYDGTRNADVPLLDHIVALGFEYYGDPRPPLSPVAPAETVKPTDYPTGENCVFARDSNGDAVPRLAPLGPGFALVKLTAAQLTDGPWCPDASNANRWDADLLRVRLIAVTLRAEAATAALRGPAGLLFANGGTAGGGSRFVPDVQVQMQIALRNVGGGR
jgi:Tfp pilus assembly protein PilW